MSPWILWPTGGTSDKATSEPDTISWSAGAQQSVPKTRDAGKCSQVKKNAADVETDGLEESDQTVGKSKGQYWAKKLKRVFNMEVSICSACGGPMKIVASIEDPIVIGKILLHLTARSCAPVSASRALGARAPPPGVC